MSPRTVSSLKGKWALVTGSSRGIGQQVALGLAEFDCNVVVHGRAKSHAARTTKLLRAFDVETAVVGGDLKTDAGVRSVLRGLPGPIDILYNNAGVQNAWEPVWEIERDTWRSIFEVNLFAVVELTNALAPGMLKRGYGRIVNLSSGIRDIPQLAPYSVSKAAVDKYTADLAAELDGTNVLVSALDPGWLRTDMGGPHGDHDVTTVLPGALIPALLPEGARNGQRFRAQEYEWR